MYERKKMETVPQIYSPYRSISRKVSRESILQKYLYACWSYYYRNPKMWNYENEYFLKVHFFDGASAKSAWIQNVVFFDIPPSANLRNDCITCAARTKGRVNQKGWRVFLNVLDLMTIYVYKFFLIFIFCCK